MNRHKSNWSVMGNEPSDCPSVKQEDFKKFEYQLMVLMGKYGKNEVLTAVRLVYESEDD